MDRSKLLASPGLIVALALLAANDAYFKFLFHNWATGKASDFAGLWAASLFLIALIPRFPRTMAFMCGAAFIIWKSVYVQPLIDWWNLANLPPVWRMPDATDYLALSVLPFAALYARHRLKATLEFPRAKLRKAGGLVVAGLAVILFTATQRVGDHVCCRGDYDFPFTKSEFLRRLEQAGAQSIHQTPQLSDKVGDWYSFYLPEKFCGRVVHVNIVVSEQGDRTHTSVRYILYNCSKENDPLIQERLEQIIAKIKG